jgi:hypothetical protein
MFAALLACSACGFLLVAGCSGGTEEVSTTDVKKIDEGLKDAPPPTGAETLPNPKPKIGG